MDSFNCTTSSTLPSHILMCSVLNNLTTGAWQNVSDSVLSNHTTTQALIEAASVLPTPRPSPTVNADATARQQLTMVKKICQPIVFVIGTFGNIMTLVTLCSMKSWETSFYVFLAALAVSDELVLLNGLFFLWLGAMSGWYPWGSHNVACKLVFWVLETTAKLSSWLLVALTLQRMVAVIWPHRVQVLCTRWRSLMLVGALTLFFMLLHAQYLSALRLKEVRNGTYACLYNPSDLAYMKYVDLIFFTLLPFACLLLSNCVLAWKLAASVRDAHHQLTSGHVHQQINDRQKQASSTTVTVMALSLAFFVFTLPICVRNILHFLGMTMKGVDGEVFTFVASLLGYCNNAVNFYLYCLTGTKFRHQFTRLMCSCFCRKY